VSSSEEFTKGASDTEKLDFIIKNMASKNDIDSLSKSFDQKLQVSIQPIKEEVKDLSNRVKTLEDKTDGNNLSSSQSISNNAILTSMQKAVEALDPALLQISFIGFPEQMSVEKRIEEIKKFMSDNFKNVDCGPIDAVYKGPYNNRQLSSECTLQLWNRNQKHIVMKKIKNSNLTLRCNGNDLKIAHTRTKKQKKRNYHMHKANELISKDKHAFGKSVEMDWAMPMRRVKVDGVTAFEQRKEDEEGCFLPPFNELKFP